MTDVEALCPDGTLEDELEASDKRFAEELHRRREAYARHGFQL